MRALITGASSGIGRDFAIYLSKLGYDLILVARREQKLKELKSEISTDALIIPLDLSKKENCFELFEKTKDMDVDVLINNAGFGAFGPFCETSLEKELELIDTNIRALHILTKLFFKKFKENNRGYILNVASIAAFFSGPLLSSYYASKGYVLKLTEALNEELSRDKSNVYIGVLCPGPVDTEFDKVANVKFSLKGLKSAYVAKYAIDMMFKKKMIIIPGIKMKLSAVFSKFLPRIVLLKIAYHFQKSKQ